MKLLRNILFVIFTVLCVSSLAIAKTTDKDTSKKDAEIIAFVIALNQHEIQAADEATAKNIDATVLDFAKMMKKDHEQNLSDAKAIGDTINVTPDDTKAVENFKMKGEKALTAMNALNDHKFEVAYMKAMVKGHADAISMVDGFMKKTKNDTLKSFLKGTRDTIAMHLQDAKKTYNEISKSTKA